ncbi:hypothetical protein XS74_22860 [Salmonella enterica subsp. enterica]|nr:hypothetical protein [Salmonella enterica subsp. enterica]EDT7315668.1 hypothetical protein [Salmonella enterica subsp. enterica]
MNKAHFLLPKSLYEKYTDFFSAYQLLEKVNKNDMAYDILYFKALRNEVTKKSFDNLINKLAQHICAGESMRFFLVKKLCRYLFVLPCKRKK